MLRNHTSSYQSDQWFKTAYLIRRRDIESPIDSPLPLSFASRRITSGSTKCRMRTYTGSNSSTGTRSRFAARCPTFCVYWLPCPTQYRSGYGQITSNTEFYPSHRAARYRLSRERDSGAFAIKFPSQLCADKAAKPRARKLSPKAEGPGIPADVFNLVTRRRRVNPASQERSQKRRINSN